MCGKFEINSCCKASLVKSHLLSEHQTGGALSMEPNRLCQSFAVESMRDGAGRGLNRSVTEELQDFRAC